MVTRKLVPEGSGAIEQHVKNLERRSGFSQVLQVGYVVLYNELKKVSLSTITCN